MNRKTRLALHLGCGPVYLLSDKKTQWVNIDVPIDGHYLTDERPDLVKTNGTDTEHYYKYEVTKEDILSGNLQKQEVVCDKFADVMALGYKEGSVDEIRAYQLFEHLTFKEGKKALLYWYLLLKEGGVLYLDVPDLDGTAIGYADAQSDEDRLWFRRLLFGSQKDTYGLHKSMYNRKQLKDVLLEVGFREVDFGKNIHFYPAYSVIGIK